MAVDMFKCHCKIEVEVQQLARWQIQCKIVASCRNRQTHSEQARVACQLSPKMASVIAVQQLSLVVEQRTRTLANWSIAYETAALHSAFQCIKLICTHQDQMVKLVPSHKVCTSVFAAQHALAGVPPQHAFFLGVATRRI
jgi:hypothetical protein